jgi:hypothetical protein
MIPKEDLAELRRAKSLLENPGLAAKLSGVLGTPFEKGMKMLPARVQKTVHTATEAALMKALDVAVRSLGARPLHRAAPGEDPRLGAGAARLREALSRNTLEPFGGSTAI